MATASKSLHSLQLVQRDVDGNSTLAGREELHGREFDLLTRLVDGKLLFNFDPTNDATREAGVFALLTLLDQIPSDKRIVFASPGSHKSERMAREVVAAYCQKTGMDHTLFILEKSADDPRERDGGFDGHVQAYIPVTSPPDEPRHLALSLEQEKEIKQEIENGAIVVVLDDILSTGATIEAIEKLLEKIGALVYARFAVGVEYPAELVEKQEDIVIWRKKDLPEPKLEVQTAFALPLFEGSDVAIIRERYT